jgi:tetratricopeptide (TPR) repeat protein
MNMKGRTWVLFFLLWGFAGLLGPQRGGAQTHQARLDQGIKFYRVGQWRDAMTELRLSQRQAVDPGQVSASLYWLSLTEFAMGEYEAALRDMNELQRVAPAGMRMDDITFSKGRALYYLERPAEALPPFRAYGDTLDRQNTPNTQAEKTVLAYWIGECLYALGQGEQAEALFTQVVTAYPRSEKYEAAASRLALIEQEGIAKELLGTVSMSYAEYQQALEEYEQRLAEAEMQIRALEGGQVDGATMPGSNASSPESGPADAVERIRELKAAAEKRRSELNLME